MKLSFKTFWAVALVLLISFSACKKDDDKKSEPMTCDLETMAKKFDEESLVVTYKLENTGDAKVTSFFYYDESGKVEVQNPSLPYEIRVTLTNQKSMQTGAVGSVTNGSIEVSFESKGQGYSYEGSDFCSRSSN